MTTTSTTDPTAVQEYDAVHEEATIFGYVGPDLFAGPIQGMFEWHDQNGPAVDMHG